MPLVEWQMTFEATSFNAELNKFQLGSWKEEAKSVEVLQRPMTEVDISGGGLRVEAYTCNGFCATFTSCGECAASAECGWCDDGDGGGACRPAEEAAVWKPPCSMKVWNAVSWRQENLKD